ncbi:hypothetical protein DM813_09415 [Pseudomonas alkylphenolica]|uniref:Uncharacterized protein n=1 Tax=Pseudomonas alkylphenolica TaxID=237609 RepID=A0A443ZVI0_9PSED|nr:hypothetical protein [Pseudomonas alkylphenolica]RWU24024.1 hypothetical protein DM813_09415 [Pseudomonas alkylphenolica]
MPIRPRPFRLECEACGWRKTIAPRSDALMPGEWYERCPKCNGVVTFKALEGPVQQFIAKWLASLRGK